MSFGAGMAAGMGAGIGSGIAMGIASGRKRAVTEIRDHIERNDITLMDRQGVPLKIDQVLDDAVSESCGSSCSNSNNTAIVILLVLFGLLIFGVAAALAVYFGMAR